MARSDFSLVTVANAPSEAQVIGSIHPSVPGTHRLRVTSASTPLDGEVRFRRNLVSKTNVGVGFFSRLRSDASTHPHVVGLLRILSLSSPETYYRIRFNPNSGVWRIERVVSGVNTLLLDSGALDTSNSGAVYETRGMVVDSGGQTILQIEKRNITNGEMAWTTLGTVIDPAPIAGPGGVGFAILASSTGGVGCDPNQSVDMDNWREFDAT